MYKRLLTIGLLLRVFLGVGHAQNYTPANMGLTFDNPNVLSVLDSANIWAPIGAINTNTHQFSFTAQVLPNTILYQTHAALIAATTAFTAFKLEQQGYYATGDGGWAEYDWNAISTATHDGVFIIKPSSQSSGTPGRYLLRIPAEGIHPEAAGAYCDYPIGGPAVHDDTTALNNLSTYISQAGAVTASSGVGTIVQTGAKTTGCYVGSGNFVLQSGVKLKGVGWSISENVASFTAVPFIELNPSFSIVGNGTSLIDNAVIWRAGLKKVPANFEDVYTYQTTTIADGSTGVKLSGQYSGIADSVVVGFNTDVAGTNAGVYASNLYGDGGTVLDISNDGDVSKIDHVRGLPLWSQTLAHHMGVWAGIAITGAGAAGYVAGDLLTVPGGTCTTQPVLRVATVDGGGQPLTYTVSDPGDCTVPPETWGATAAATHDGGTGGTGSGNVTVATGTCTTQPVIGVTVAAGAITGVTGITTAGACPITSSMPEYLTGVTGLSLSGARLTVTYGRNPITLTGGTGTGATATVKVQDETYRNGNCLSFHDRFDGGEVNVGECEGWQTSLYLSNIFAAKFRYAGGEGFPNNFDHQTVGIDTENCVTDVELTEPLMNSNYIGMTLNHKSAANGGTCTSGLTGQSINIRGGHPSYIKFFSAAAIKTGAYSSGLLDGQMMSWDSAANLASPPVQIGANSGLWRIENLQFDYWPIAPSWYAQWISVDPTATPPISNQFGSRMRGSILLNGDFVLDQQNEGASGVTVNRRADGWMLSSNANGGAHLTSTRVSNGPFNYPYNIDFSQDATTLTPTAAQSTSLIQTVYGEEMIGYGSGSSVNQGQPFVLEYCLQANNTGTYSLEMTTGAGANLWAYLIPVSLTANAWTCSGTVIPPSPVAMSIAQGASSIIVRVDLGSGTNFQSSTTNTWVNTGANDSREVTGAFQMTANSGATLNIGYLHLRPGPFLPASGYQWNDPIVELYRAQRRYAKSFNIGTKPAANSTTVGASTSVLPVAAVAPGWLQPFPVMMEGTPGTITFFNTSAANANCRDATTGPADLGAASAVNTGATGMMIKCALAGAPAAGDTVQVQWTADFGS